LGGNSSSGIFSGVENSAMIAGGRGKCRGCVRDHGRDLRGGRGRGDKVTRHYVL